MPDSDAVRVVFAYQQAVRRVRQRVVAYVQGAWVGLDDWRDSDIDQFVAAVVPVVTGGQRAVSSLTAAYLANFESTVLGRRTVQPPIGLPADLRGTPPEEIYRRPATTMRTALAEGSSFSDALTQSARRAVSLAQTDLQLAKTHTSQRIVRGQKNIVGYRRVLTGGESCALCIVASTQRYRRSRLMPIHPGCDCSVAPIYGKKDPGRVIDPKRLDGVHEALQARFGAVRRDAADYRNVLVTHEHGELGPVLAVRGHQFTGPNDF